MSSLRIKLGPITVKKEEAYENLPAEIGKDTINNVDDEHDLYSKPLWLYRSLSDDHMEGYIHRLIVETAHPQFSTVQSFLTAIGEPRSRTQHVHEYEITPDSVRSASLLGWGLCGMEERLRLWSCPREIVDVFMAYIQECVQGISHVKLVLRSKEGGAEIVYRLESTTTALLNAFAYAPSLQDCFVLPLRREQLAELIDGTVGEVSSLELSCVSVLEKVKETAFKEFKTPLETHYDFTKDDFTPRIENFVLRPAAQLRPYQVDAISSVFSGNRARSGVIVLPCGAGKTLTGVSIAARIAKKVLVLCVNVVSVNQWREQFMAWSTLAAHQVSVLTSLQRQDIADVVITTYNQITFGGENVKRNADSQRIVDMILESSFGLVLFDEVHVAPAKTFRTIVSKVKGHCLIGLTATLLREDDKIDDLHYLLGPKLYEASSHHLTSLGYLAPVACVEVLCPLPSLFHQAYLNNPSVHTRRKIYDLNPEKIWCCQALLKYHESKSPPDKTLVFVENIACLEFCAQTFGRPMLTGKCPQEERANIISHFKYGTVINTLFISKVGDSALDIPDANVIIQLSSMFGSQRTEVQRLGRILRVKSQATMAYFYSLITPDTAEATFARKRQRFLLNQGYAYKVIRSSAIICPTAAAENFRKCCVGPPHWSYETSQCPRASLGQRDSFQVEKAFLGGKTNVHLGWWSITETFPRPPAGTVGLPLLGQPQILGSLIRGPTEEHTCVTECFQFFLDFVVQAVPSGEENDEEPPEGGAKKGKGTSQSFQSFCERWVHAWEGETPVVSKRMNKSAATLGRGRPTATDVDGTTSKGRKSARKSS